MDFDLYVITLVDCLIKLFAEEVVTGASEGEGIRVCNIDKHTM